MTVRQAEIMMAVILGALSVALMWKSSELEIGWVKGEGPGGGAWPFWLSAVMLLSCVVTAFRWFIGATSQSRNTELYIDRDTGKIVATTVISLAVTLALTDLISMYFALMLYLLFYLRVMGKHTWLFSVGLAVGLPVGAFFFFEGLLKISLPKGKIEPLFYPLYRLIY